MPTGHGNHGSGNHHGFGSHHGYSSLGSHSSRQSSHHATHLQHHHNFMGNDHTRQHYGSHGHGTVVTAGCLYHYYQTYQACIGSDCFGRLLLWCGPVLFVGLTFTIIGSTMDITGLLATGILFIIGGLGVLVFRGGPRFCENHGEPAASSTARQSMAGVPGTFPGVVESVPSARVYLNQQYPEEPRSYPEGTTASQAAPLVPFSDPLVSHPLPNVPPQAGDMLAGVPGAFSGPYHAQAAVAAFAEGSAGLPSYTDVMSAGTAKIPIEDTMQPIDSWK